MWLDSSFSLTVEAETSKYQQMQELACRALTTLAQDLSKKKAFPAKFSCAQFYLNDISDTWPDQISLPGELYRGTLGLCEQAGTPRCYHRKYGTISTL